MSDNTQQAASSGFGFGGLLAILFIGLKLCDKIDWSWWWVLSPLWIPFAIVFGIVAVVLIFIGIVKLIESIVNSVGDNSVNVREVRKKRGL